MVHRGAVCLPIWQDSQTHWAWNFTRNLLVGGQVFRFTLYSASSVELPRAQWIHIFYSEVPGHKDGFKSECERYTKHNLINSIHFIPWGESTAFDEYALCFKFLWHILKNKSQNVNYPAGIEAYFQKKQIEIEANYARHCLKFWKCVDHRTILKFLLCKNSTSLHSSAGEFFLHEIAKLKLIAIFSGINLN